MSTSTPMADLYPGLPAAATITTVDQQKLMDLAVRFTNLVVDAIPAGSIAPADYSGRTESALREAATAGTYPEAVALAVESVAPGQRGALSAATQEALVALGGELGDRDVFAAWAEMLGRDCVYVVAATMVGRRDRRAAAGKRKPDPAPPASSVEASVLGTASETGRSDAEGLF